jgi:hypothetical protein
MTALAAVYLAHAWCSDPELIATVERFLTSLELPIAERIVTAEDRAAPIVHAIESARVWVWERPGIAVDRPSVFPSSPLPDVPSYLPDRPRTPTPTWTLVSFEYVRVVAPGAEDPKPPLRWRVDDPQAQVTSGRIEVFAPGRESPVGVLHLNLAALERGERPWDGHVGTAGPFRSGYLSCEHSEYLLRLVIEAEVGAPQSKECRVRVEVVDLRLLAGPRNLLDLERHREVFDRVFGSEGEPVAEDVPVELPPPNRTVKVPLRSNLFGTYNPEQPEDEQQSASAASFEQYRLLWGDGPELPLLAGVFFRSSRNQAVLAPKAWGNRRVLWDWRERKEDLSGLAAPVAAYIDAARNYLPDEPRPTGHTACHVDRGGKRSRDGRPPLFTTNQRAPFRVRTVDAYPTGAWSEPIQEGDLAGYAGVVLRPPRQAGEALSAHAYFSTQALPGIEVEGKVDLESADLQARTPVFEVWRTIDIALHLRKRDDIPPVDIAAAARYFLPAFLELRNLTRQVDVIPADTYNYTIRAAIAQCEEPVGTNPLYAEFKAQDHLFNRPADHAAAREAVVVHPQGEMLKSFRVWLKNRPSTGFDAPKGTDDASLMDALYLESGKSRYEKRVSDIASRVLHRALHNVAATTRGLIIFQAEDLTATGSLGGFVLDDARHWGSICLFDTSLAPPRSLAHEVGHELFLPHRVPPSKEGGEGEEAADPRAHDPVDAACLMSYRAPDHFCGLCVLRLRGWDHRTLIEQGQE